MFVSLAVLWTHTYNAVTHADHPSLPTKIGNKECRKLNYFIRDDKRA